MNPNASDTTTAAGTARFAPINGLDLYYEIHGQGAPLAVIPGGLMTAALMGSLVSVLSRSWQVIAIEPQGHGHTADVDRPLSYEQLADDTAALIRHLGLGRADLLGFSMGAGVALQTAVRHPDTVRRLVVVSGVFRGDGEFPEARAFAAAFAPDMPALAPLRAAYLAAAPNPADWTTLVAKMRRLLAAEYDWSAEVAAITAPALVVVGDADTVPVAHAAELFRLLGGGTAATALGTLSKAQLAVLPATTHFAIVQNPDLPPLVARFLNAPPPEVDRRSAHPASHAAPPRLSANRRGACRGKARYGEIEARMEVGHDPKHASPRRPRRRWVASVAVG